MLWQFSGDAPIYSQLIEQIKVGIVSGVFPPGERLPSVRDLATEAGVNPNTMQRALAQLEQDGLAKADRTAGRLVTRDAAALEAVRIQEARAVIQQYFEAMAALGYTREQALALLKAKKGGSYNVIQIDASYVPAPVERKQVYGITFEQGRNELDVNGDLLSNIVTVNKEIPEAAMIDLKIALITLKYTQSNSVCYVKGGQAIGIGAGQQSRIHCTRLAGTKADNWFLRQSPQVLGLQFVDKLGRPDRDNAIDVYIGDEYMDVLEDGAWEKVFKVKPPVFTREEKRAWLEQMKEVTLGSDAFFPFSDNIERARKSGVRYIAQPGGSVRDDAVIECCDKYGMMMTFTGIRLFHH